MYWNRSGALRRKGTARVASSLAVLFLAASFSAHAGPQLDPSFRGDWVPVRESCASPLRLTVGHDRLVFRNGQDRESFAALEVCRDCEGDQRYRKSVWVSPVVGEDRYAPFIAFLNYGQKPDAALLEIPESKLRKRFPLHQAVLRKCAT